MKERIGYLTEYEYLTLPADKKYQYIKKLENLKRRMRSLIADQENSLNVVKFYMGYSEIQDKAYFNSSMLKSFVGKELYYDDIRRIKNGKEAYDRASLSVKKNMQKYYHPINYFTLPAMFDYYLYREAIIANFPRSEKPSKVKLDVVSLFEQSMESSLLDSRPENFYFKHSHIQLGTPVQTYTTLERLETERDKENVKNNIPYQDRISVKNETLSDVMEFMITFSEKEGYNKNIREEYTSYILGEIEKSGWSVEKKKSLARYFNFDGREINFGESSPTKQATENVEANPEGLILQGQSNRDCGEKKPKNYNPDQFTFDI